MLLSAFFVNFVINLFGVFGVDFATVIGQSVCGNRSTLDVLLIDFEVCDGFGAVSVVILLLLFVIYRCYCELCEIVCNLAASDGSIGLSATGITSSPAPLFEGKGKLRQSLYERRLS